MDGFYRGELCPRCGEDGKFLMSAPELERVVRTMAGVLRHFPDRFDLEMDDFGYVDARDFLDAFKKRNRRFRWLRMHHLRAIVETDQKGRYEMNEGDLRATYAHTIDVEYPSAEDEDMPEVLYCPVSEADLEETLDVGLAAGDKNMVHLASTYDQAVESGRIHDPWPYILKIDVSTLTTGGVELHPAGRVLWLAHHVPGDALENTGRAPEETEELSEDDRTPSDDDETPAPAPDAVEELNRHTGLDASPDED